MICTALQAQHDAAELITQREIVSLKCREALNARAKDFHIILDDISITHLTFGQEFTHAVELKQVAQQEAERARFLVERAEQEKIANIIRAEGDSKAAKLISDALQENGTALIELRKIEVRRIRVVFRPLLGRKGRWPPLWPFVDVHTDTQTDRRRHTDTHIHTDTHTYTHTHALCCPP